MQTRYHRFPGSSLFSALCIGGALAMGAHGATPEVDVSKLPPPAAAADFARDIQPLLEENCVGCHGETKQKGKFRLDTREGLLKGGEDGKVIVEGKSAESGLIHNVARLVEDLEMPPRKEAALKPEQIGMLRAWIDAGAPWPAGVQLKATHAEGEELKDSRDHWAFKAPVKPPLPAVQNTAWPKNEIDRFILARLEKEGLQPSPEAGKAALLRRLSLDLIGLPPTVPELDAFLADESPDAYNKQVERLLASPHYGEKWGRHWLDAARYADSDGFEKDKPRFTYFYRDWVIDAFNRDLPYDQFIIQQLAGDELPNPGQDEIVATGFLRNSMLNEEGGADPEQFRMEEMFDRIDCIGKSILGITIQCAQCHTHKFDPITQQEYYRLFAYLNNDSEAQSVVYSADAQMKRAELQRQIAERELKLRQETPDWAERMAKWEQSVLAEPQPQWTVVQAPFEEISTDGEKYLLQKDGSFLAQGYAPTKSASKVTVQTDVQNITAFRLELLNDPNLPANGPGRSLKGTCALTEFEVSAAPASDPKKAEKIKLISATADYSDPADTPLESYFEDKSGKKRVTGPIDYAIDGKDETAWGMDAGPGRRNVPHQAVFVAEHPISYPAGTLLTFTLKQDHGGWNSDDLQTNNLGRFRLAITSAPHAVADRLPPQVREILAIPAAQRTPAQVAAVFSSWRSTVPEWQAANAEIEALWKQHPEGTTQLVLAQRNEPRDTHVLKRGDWLKPGRSVAAGVPAALHPLPPDAPPTRLTLAKWLVDPKSPTTARVLINRLWQEYFGIGIVSTAEDFGMQSEAPSHPELLDWLACEFMERNWSRKAIHRLIVNSAAYRQISNVSPALLERDPYNRLLARGPRFRVDGELVRDIALSTSGLLNPALGGRSVMPPAPLFIFQPPASYAPFPWIEETGPDRYRRAVYTYRRRSTPYPMLQAFDTPEGNTACVRRGRSNTPLQALMTLNETLSMEAARALARQILEQGGATDADRLTYAFRRCLSRPPSDSERAVLLTLMEKQRGRIADGWIDPWELATGKKERPELPPHTTPAQLAAYTVVSRVLLNLDETITKE